MKLYIIILFVHSYNTKYIFFRVKVTRILPLKNMEFTTMLKGSELKNIKLKVAKFGGTIVSQCTDNVAAVFAVQGMSV